MLVVAGEVMIIDEKIKERSGRSRREVEHSGMVSAGIGIAWLVFGLDMVFL